MTPIDSFPPFPVIIPNVEIPETNSWSDVMSPLEIAAFIVTLPVDLSMVMLLPAVIVVTIPDNSIPVP